MTRIVMSALLAGVLAGVLVFAGHIWKVTPLIINAEVFEVATSVPQEQKNSQAKLLDHASNVDGMSHHHRDGSGWEPADGFERNIFTLLSDVITAIGFALLLTGAMVLSGRELGWKQGMLWGLCGYAALYLAPAFGLSPELPGMAAADLTARQAWWLGTALVTAAGLAVMFFSSQVIWKLLAVIVIFLPHFIGAPHPPMTAGAVPAELAAQFAVATLVVTGMFWLALGALSGYFLDRFKDLK